MKSFEEKKSELPIPRQRKIANMAQEIKDAINLGIIIDEFIDKYIGDEEANERLKTYIDQLIEESNKKIERIKLGAKCRLEDYREKLGKAKETLKTVAESGCIASDLADRTLKEITS